MGSQGESDTDQGEWGQQTEQEKIKQDVDHTVWDYLRIRLQLAA